MISELEKLEAKGAPLASTYTYERVVEKWHETPEKLTDYEVAVVGYYGGAKEAARARTAREQALHPPVEAAPAAVAASTAHGIEFPSELWNSDAPDQVAEMERWSKAHAMKVLPLRLWWAFVRTGREKREALAAKVDALEARIAQLEAKPHVKYCGVWAETSTYHQGDAVTKAGSLWIAKLNELHSEPGNDNGVGWQLAVKRGRDGKDLR